MSSDSKYSETVAGAGRTTVNVLWTLPNALTLLRIFLVPLLVAFLLTRYAWAGLTVFLASSLTDWLDGHLARKHRHLTTL